MNFSALSDVIFKDFSLISTMFRVEIANSLEFFTKQQYRKPYHTPRFLLHPLFLKFFMTSPTTRQSIQLLSNVMLNDKITPTR